MRFQVNYRKVFVTITFICLLLGLMLATNSNKKERYEIPPKSKGEILETSTKETENIEENTEDNIKEIDEIVVYISGAVNNPSVVSLPKGSRLNDGVEAAGGLTDNANIEGVNLAMEIEDAKQYIIPSLGEELVIIGETEEDEDEGIVNINKASEKALTSLSGIGEVLAGRIVDYREVNGKFKSIDEIKKVKGIGDKKFEDIKNCIKID